MEGKLNNDMCIFINATFGGLVISVLAMGPRGLAAAGSDPAKDSRFLWVIKTGSMHFLWRGNKAVGPMS
jgi:hypothetical protein